MNSTEWRSHCLAHEILFCFVYGRVPTASLSRHGQKNRKAGYGSLILEGSRLTRILLGDWQFVGKTLLK
jgi:hypothetical protein